MPALSLWLPVKTQQLKEAEAAQYRFMRSAADAREGGELVQP
jgi:hypothetical protein